MQKLIPQKSFFAKTMKRKFDMSVEGFSVKCKDDEVVIVTPIQAGKLHENCEYFRTVFEHGTTEAHSGTIIKPDWSSVTTKRLIELITMGMVGVKHVMSSVTLLSLPAKSSTISCSIPSCKELEPLCTCCDEAVLSYV